MSAKIIWSSRVEDLLLSSHIFATMHNFSKLTPDLVLLTALQRYSKSVPVKIRKSVFQRCLENESDTMPVGRIEFDDDLMTVIKEALVPQRLSEGCLLRLDRFINALLKHHGEERTRVEESNGTCTLDVF